MKRLPLWNKKLTALAVRSFISTMFKKHWFAKGLKVEPFKIIEVCNAKSAATILKADLGELPEEIDNVICSIIDQAK